MSDKYYVGQDLVSFADKGKYKPISRVTLMIDDENCVTAGDDTGKELVATCHNATQAMADALLAQFKGYEYQAYEVDAANLNPAAEPGDGLTADGYYVTISRMDDDGSGYPSPSAPGEAELEDEYPSAGPMTQEFNRKIARTNSRITKTAEQIRLEVADSLNNLSASITVELDSVKQEIIGLENAHSEMELSLDGLTTRIQDAEGNIANLELTTQNFGVSIEGLEGDYAELALTLDGMTVTDSSGTTRIKGSSIETDSLYVKAANITGTLTAGQVVLTGAITWNDLSSGVQSTINGAYSSGLSESDVKTIITDQLVLSPNIAGGKFWNLDQDTWIEIGYDSGRYGLLLADKTHGHGIFGVYNGDFGYTSFVGKQNYTFLMTEGTSQTTEPLGKWDFSGATVTGLDSSITVNAVWG